MARLGEAPFVHDGATVVNSQLGRWVEIGAGSRLNEAVLDDYSYCDRFADIFCAHIGKFANIAAFSRINPGNHPTERASLHHFMYRSASYWDDAEDDEAFFDWRRDHACHVGHDTWIGHGAIILPGRKLGDGAVVGAGAVVTKDVAPYTIVGGAPAEPIRRRFDQSTTDRLRALAWWDWDHQRIRSALPDFRTLSTLAFLEKYEG